MGSLTSKAIAMSNTLRHLRRLTLCFVALMPALHAQEKELMIYCGITMVRPITELARQFEQTEKIKVTITQGGSEDLYQSGI